MSQSTPSFGRIHKFIRNCFSACLKISDARILGLNIIMSDFHCKGCCCSVG